MATVMEFLFIIMVKLFVKIYTRSLTIEGLEVEKYDADLAFSKHSYWSEAFIDPAKITTFCDSAKLPGHSCIYLDSDESFYTKGTVSEIMASIKEQCESGQTFFLNVPN